MCGLLCGGGSIHFAVLFVISAPLFCVFVCFCSFVVLFIFAVFVRQCCYNSFLADVGVGVIVVVVAAVVAAIVAAGHHTNPSCCCCFCCCCCLRALQLSNCFILFCRHPARVIAVVENVQRPINQIFFCCW